MTMAMMTDIPEIKLMWGRSHGAILVISIVSVNRKRVYVAGSLDWTRNDFSLHWNACKCLINFKGRSARTRGKTFFSSNRRRSLDCVRMSRVCTCICVFMYTCISCVCVCLCTCVCVCMYPYMNDRPALRWSRKSQHSRMRVNWK